MIPYYAVFAGVLAATASAFAKLAIDDGSFLLKYLEVTLKDFEFLEPVSGTLCRQASSINRVCILTLLITNGIGFIYQ